MSRMVIVLSALFGCFALLQLFGRTSNLVGGGSAKQDAAVRACAEAVQRSRYGLSILVLKSGGRV